MARNAEGLDSLVSGAVWRWAKYLLTYTDRMVNAAPVEPTVSLWAKMLGFWVFGFSAGRFLFYSGMRVGGSKKVGKLLGSYFCSAIIERGTVSSSFWVLGPLTGCVHHQKTKPYWAHWFPGYTFLLFTPTVPTQPTSVPV